jgi:hypothetical protein
MNTEGIGNPIFKIIDKNKKEKDYQTVYYDQNYKNGRSEISLSIDEHTQLIPSNRERDVLYIAGQSGSGKSYFAAHYIREYVKKYKDRPIYLFSSVSTDDNLDKIKQLKRIKLDENFINTTIGISDFKNSLAIFDDIDVIRNKKIRAKVWNLLNAILQIGRHENCTVIQISHVINAGNETRIVLMESHSITIFPRTIGQRSLKYLLEMYLGYSKNQIQKIKKIGTESRAVTFLRQYPNIVLYEKGAQIFDTLQNE